MKSRLKRMTINPKAFFHVMCEGTGWKVSKGIPKGARLAGFTLDPTTQNLTLFIEHDSFDEIDVNDQVAPLLETEFRKF